MATTTRPSLTVEQRAERGSRAARRLRRRGLVPGVLYGGGDGESHTFAVGSRDLRLALHSGSALLDLKIGDDKPRPVIVKDQQHDPVRGDVLHIDFLQVRLDEKIHALVAIELEGGEEAPGVNEGGVLEHTTREVNIEALPTDIPERIVVDVSGMAIAATMHLSEVAAPAGVDFLDDLEETIIATITLPSEVEEPEVEVETELVGEAEGDAAAAEAGEGAESGDGSSGGGSGAGGS